MQGVGETRHRQCWNWGYLKPDGTRYRVCRYHGALGAEYGHIAWRKVVRSDKDITVPVGEGGSRE
jgi:hypothetical protein